MRSRRLIAARHTPLARAGGRRGARVIRVYPNGRVSVQTRPVLMGEIPAREAGLATVNTVLRCRCDAVLAAAPRDLESSSDSRKRVCMP
ncbi:hypothetical protein NL676_023119 [Syzygium grande]|nr:hypothetical protein NL676_023119 [Syzygium grande]